MKTQRMLCAITVTGLLAGAIYPGISKREADMAKEAVSTPGNPKKKKAGEECKTSDECRRHHRCEKVAEKSVCVAPELREIPKT